MSVTGEMEERIAKVVAEFEERQMGLRPSSILVNLLDNALFVVLEGVSSPAEKECAGTDESHDLLEHYHGRLFAAGREALETEIQSILGRTVKHSSLMVDPISGTGVMQFALGEPNK